MSFTKQLSRWILGERLPNAKLGDQNFSVFWGMPILSSDAISSVAYAFDEMLWILVPVIGLGSYLWLPKVAGAIVLLLLLLILSYRQVVQAYPNGGGAYVVAKTNLGPVYGLIAGASLFVGYILTVAVSISSGVAAVISALPSLYHYRVGLCIVMIILMVLGNLRGVKDASRWFSIPTYAFILSCLAIIGVGLFKHFTGNYVSVSSPAVATATLGTAAVTPFLILRTFSSGCAALTGVEAISNSVPNFAKPSVDNARKAYLLLGLAVFVTFFGMSAVTLLYHAVPSYHQTVVSQIALTLFGKGVAFYFIQLTTMLILVMAANTAFTGFPILLSLIASDGYAPRQLALRGHRLNYSNGIIALAVLAALLVVIFGGDTHRLIPLYAIGVFTSFTLSQTGMVRHWLKTRGEGWHYKLGVNGLGAVLTLVTVVIVAMTKFSEGAWMVVLIVPALVYLMLRVRRHYTSVARQLDVPNDVLARISVEPDYEHHVIIPIDSLNVMVIKALRYAKSLSDNVEAFHVEPREGEADKLRAKWEMLDTDVPLIIKPSPYREVIRPLLKYINSEEHASKPGDMITVLLPQFVVNKWWQMILHNNTSLFIANALFHNRNLVVSILPFYLGDVAVQRRKQKQMVTGDETTSGEKLV